MMNAGATAWTCGTRTLALTERPVIMGIVNVTPDSFSDGGLFFDADAAVAHGLALLEAGADIVDVGGESTRPGAPAVAADEELRRVLPVIRRLAAHPGALISVDTSKATVARAALQAGAAVINDVSACTDDPAMVAVAREAGCGLVLMHRRGTPETMQKNPVYDDVVREVGDFLAARAGALVEAGIDPARIALDPGIGFGKTLAHNLALLAGLGTIVALGYPVLLGLSRKRFLGELTGKSVEQRLAGSLAGAVYGMLQGAQGLRVHDVAETRDAVSVIAALQRQERT